MKRRNNIFVVLALLMAGVSACNCHSVDPEPQGKYGNVAILYSVGRNNLCDDLLMDIDDLASGKVPLLTDSNAVVVVQHHYQNKYDAESDSYISQTYILDSSPLVVRLYKDPDNLKVVRDTIKRFPARNEAGGYPNLLTDPGFMKEILSYVKEKFPARKYGMIYSSHGFGWLPQGYYADTESFEKENALSAPSIHRQSLPGLPEGARPYVEPEVDPDIPLTKSVGQELFLYDGKKFSLEIDVRDLAESIPMHMDYIFFDACLMGGIEVAYELKDVADFLVFSPAEIISEGFDYSKMCDRLFANYDLHAKLVAKDYYDYYQAQSGTLQSATITMVRCVDLDKLAAVCQPLFEKYRDNINKLTRTQVQTYSRINIGKHWFYDMEDMLLKAGMTESEQAELEKVLKQVAPYRAATKYILGLLPVRKYSGFSMFLPPDGSDYLRNYYKTLAWNKATGLVD